jgi:hypothetical protein
MNLKDYFKNRFDSVEGVAYKCELTASAIWHYLSGRRKPSQKTAQRIEIETGGRVTVFEQRGKDDRIRK